MNDTQKTFLNIIKAYLNSDTDAHKYIISDELLQYAKDHEVQAIFYYQTKSSRLLEQYSFSLHNYQNRLRLLKQIEMLLCGYDYVVVKGTEVANYYPVPSLRSMGDTDIIVQPNQKKEIAEELRKHGFEIEDVSGYHEWHLSKNSIDFELHHSLFYGSEASNKLVKFFNDWPEYINGHRLDSNYHFVYLIAHLRKHMLSFGVGFRQFMDIAVYSKCVSDWEQIKNWLKEINMADFAGVVFELIYRWWEIEIPLRKQLEDSFYEEATNNIFNNGVFGYQNENARKNRMTTMGIDKGTQSIFRRIFPPIKEFKQYAGYEFLNNSKMLYPMAVTKRVFNHIKDRQAYRKKYKDSIPDKKYIRKRKEYLAQWGL